MRGGAMQHQGGGRWSSIFDELKSYPSPLDSLRHKYLEDLEKQTNRTIICYYSGWQQGRKNQIDINDSDMEGFMSSINGLDRKKGLSLVLHTPGGDPNAAESIVSYLRSMFDDNIEVIVPHMAMSAGTMISCASKKIWMGKHSSLGPVDPQIGGLPAYNIISEFDEAYRDLQENANNLQYWSLLLGKYPAAYVKFAQDAVQLSGELIESWLSSVMFADDPHPDEKVKAIVKRLNEHTRSKAHARHFNIDLAREIGLKVNALEDDQNLQNSVLSLHHSIMITLQQTNVSKLIESKSSSYIVSDQSRRNP